MLPPLVRLQRVPLRAERPPTPGRGRARDALSRVREAVPQGPGGAGRGGRGLSALRSRAGRPGSPQLSRAIVTMVEVRVVHIHFHFAVVPLEVSSHRRHRLYCGEFVHTTTVVRDD